MSVLSRLFGRAPSATDLEVARHQDEIEAFNKRLAEEYEERAAIIDQVQVTPTMERLGVPTPRSVTSPGETYARHIWTFAAVSITAQSVAMLRVKAVGRDGNETELPKDFRRPNAACSMMEHVEFLVEDLRLTGTAYEYIADDGLWRIDPRRVKVIPDRKTRIRGYEYDAGGGKKITLDPELMIVRRLPNPVDDYYGIGPGAVAEEAVKLDLQMNAYNKGFFERGSRLGLVFETDLELSRQKRAQMVREFTHAHAGVKNHFRAMVASHGLKVKEPGESHRDMEFGLGKELLRDEILAAHRVPPVLVGLTDSVNYANAREQLRIFYLFSVLPLARRIAAAWVEHPILFPVPGKLRVEFDEKEVHDLLLDPQVIAGAASQLYQAGLYGRDHIRAKFFRDGPVDAAELKDIKAQPAASPFGFSFPPMGQLEAARGLLREATRARRATRTASESEEPEGQAVRWAPLPEWDQKAWGEEILKGQDRGTLVLRDKVIRPLLRRQRDRLIAALGGATKAGPSDGDGPWRSADELFDFLHEDDDLFASLYRDAAQNEAVNSAQITFARLGLPPDAFEINDPAVTEWAKDQSFRFAADVNESTAGTVQSVYAQAIDEGATLDEIADRIKSTYDDWVGEDGELAETRAMRIARTETVAAQNFGVLEGFGQSEIVEGKTWMTLGDAAVRASHAALEGTTVGLDSNFPNGLGYPGDMQAGKASETVNCRCTIQPAVAVE